MTLPSADRGSERARARAGFSLIELIVAILVMTVGVLGLAGTAAVVLRQLSAGTELTLAANAALARFEQLRSTDCTGIAGGTASGRGVTEVWTVTAATRAKTVTDTVKWNVRGVQKTQAYKSSIPCA